MKHRWNKGKKDANVLPNGNKIIHLKVGGRTSAVVPAVQKKTGPVAGDIDENEVEEEGEKPKVKAKKGKSTTKKEHSENSASETEKPKPKGRKRKAAVKEESSADEEASEEEKKKPNPAKTKAANGLNTVKKESKVSKKPKTMTERPVSERRSGRGATTKSYEEVEEESD
jgi:formamidopyrimidine-DNA glycosylase